MIMASKCAKINYREPVEGDTDGIGIVGACVVGSMVGSIVGSILGLLVGDCVESVGSEVGDSDGDLVGGLLQRVSPDVSHPQ